MLEIVNWSIEVLQLVFDDAKVLETIHVECFLVGEELLEVFLAGGVAFGKQTRPLMFLLLHSVTLCITQCYTVIL